MTRRQFLTAAAGALAVPFGSFARAFAKESAKRRIRVGAVLPLKVSGRASEAAVYDVAAERARMGAVMAGDELGTNGALLGVDLKVLPASAPTPEAARRAAERLIATEDVTALCGGYGLEQAKTLARVAEERGVPFFNIGSPSDSLRGTGCGRHTFHIEASAAMYIDALLGWFVHAGHRRWFFVYPDSPEGKARYHRCQKAIDERHWGAREVGALAVAPGEPAYVTKFDAIQDANPDVVMLLTNSDDQLNFVGQYEGNGSGARVTGFPDPATQTRTYFSYLRQIAPQVGAGYRSTLWETTVDRYGGRELNARFVSRWGQPMDPPAWAAYAAVKVLYSAVLFTKSTSSKAILEYLEDPETVFDVYKGIGVSFRPWDHQLRQSLYLVKVNPDAPLTQKIDDRIALASLVGELPAIYKPGTDPVERLDQLGDLRADSTCSF